MPNKKPSIETTLHVNRTICDGAAMCALKAPHLISLDRWGFPLITDKPLPAGKLTSEATKAINACPRKALYLEQAKTKQP
jgi:ferredoxin